MMSWEYKGYTIKLREERGDFIAIGPNKNIVGPSLAAVKSKIDKLAGFIPFAALTIAYGTIKEHQIVGVSKARGRYRGAQWLTAGGSELTTIIRDTPENRAKIQFYLDTETKNSKEIERLRHEIGNARDAIPNEFPGQGDA